MALLDAYKSRYRQAHICSLVAIVLALCFSAAFVLGRAHSGRIPQPLTRSVAVPAGLAGSDICSCSCGAEQGTAAGQRQDVSEAHQQLQCLLRRGSSGQGGARPERLRRLQHDSAVDPAYGTPQPAMPSGLQWSDAALASNLSSCITSMSSFSVGVGPQPKVERCYCDFSHPSSTLCEVSFSFSDSSIRWANLASLLQLLVALAVVIWDVQYVAGMYGAVIPRAPEDDICEKWFGRWLDSFTDQTHGAALWTIWGQLVAISVALPNGHYPAPRDYTDPEERALVGGWSPTGTDEALNWLGLLAVVLAGLQVLRASPMITNQGPRVGVGGSPVAGGESSPGTSAGGASDTAAATPACARMAMIFPLLLASMGFVLGQPLSTVYALVVTVPFLVLQMSRTHASAWPLERPFPMFQVSWPVLAKHQESQQKALQLIEELEGSPHQAKDRGSAPGRIRTLCNVVLELRRLQPWRRIADVDERLRALLLKRLRSAIAGRDEHLLRHFLSCMKLVGYTPPTDEARNDDDEEEGSRSKKEGRKGWFSWGYQRLMAKPSDPDAEGGPLLGGSDEWNSEVHQVLRDALKLALESARLLEEEPSSRWLGAVFAALHPGAVQELSAHLGRAAHCLQKEVAEEVSWDAGEMLQHLAACSGLVPDVPGDINQTAFGWALRLPRRERKGTVSNLSQCAASKAGSPPRDPQLVVVDGPPAAAALEKCRVLSCRPLLVASNGYRVPIGPGRWFYEVHILGHALGAMSQDLVPTSCRLGWLQHDLSWPHNLPSNSSPSTRKPRVELNPQMSCTLEEFSLPEAGSNQVGPSRSAAAACGVVGCALEITGRPGGGHHCRAWFALDGDWGLADWSPSSTQQAEDLVRIPFREWIQGPLAAEPLAPCVSGRLACDIAFEAGGFLYGPPDDSFRPLAEAPGDCAASGTQLALGTGDAPAASIFGRKVPPDEATLPLAEQRV
eukprot:TRINITY_DN33250_c0_g1_i1.p1 TRINITY_DN33250_c0_g1~~TRINITY_DN33250_c0_g1_i1.p1  ORF type:complete len:959 (-),score=180.69 TRINITY_DN33250_c0_g1_i1:617-3493(-)